MVQWSGLHTFTANGIGLIPGQRTKIPQARRKEKKEGRKEREERKEKKGVNLKCM